MPDRAEDGGAASDDPFGDEQLACRQRSDAMRAAQLGKGEVRRGDLITGPSVEPDCVRWDRRVAYARDNVRDPVQADHCAEQF